MVSCKLLGSKPNIIRANKKYLKSSNLTCYGRLMSLKISQIPGRHRPHLEFSGRDQNNPEDHTNSADFRWSAVQILMLSFY